MLAAVVAAALLWPVALAHSADATSGQTVLVTGATGETGSLIFNLLAGRDAPQGWRVTGLVRNRTKAKELLKCGDCTEKEGIFVGDVTKPETLVPAMRDATVLVIATSAVVRCSGGMETCVYPKGGYPIDVDWKGGLAQLKAFGNATHGKGHAILISTRGTTEPDNFLDKLGKGHISFYKLNLEAWLATSGLASTIVKPCGLDNTAPQKKEIVVGHDDEDLGKSNMISRGDIARLVVAAAQHRELSAGERIDVCGGEGAPQSPEALPGLFKVARWPWEASRDVSAVEATVASAEATVASAVAI